VPQRSTPPIVAIRRRAPVNLHTAAGPDSQTGVHVYADGRLIASIETEAELVPAVAGLLRGPAWLFLVAARLPVQIIGRLWVLVPAEAWDFGSAPRDLRDDDAVYAYPIADVERAAENSAGDDLAAEAGRLLEATTSMDTGAG
jgi:hypothetical protein